MQQQHAVCGYAWSADVIGEGWAHYDESNRREPRAVRVERDEAWVERVGAACRDGWARVEELMASRKDGG